MIQRIEFKVGLFITITSLLIMASIGYVAYKKGVFSKVYTYTLSSKTGENLTEGMPVAVWGFTIGRVSSLELNDQGTVLIRIKIPERHIRMIRAGSKFVLDKPLIGSPRIIVKTTDLNDLPLSTEMIPELTESNDINEIIKRAQPIVDKADRIMANITQITANLADPAGDVNRILRDAEALIARFSKRDSLLEMAVGDPESVKSVHEALKKLRDITGKADGILQRVDAMAGKADGILQRVDAMAGKTDEELYGRDGVLPQFRNILRDLLAKLAKIDATFDNINKVSSEAADSTKDLRALRNELDETVTAIGNLADEIDRKIPFKTRPEIKLP
jgi:phospholipid/cholesterol/gamma-HCH transport system substrate-binding protein